MKRWQHFLFLFFTVCSTFPSISHAVTLKFDTDYRLRGLHYDNIDYESSTNDRRTFYSQRLRVGVAAKDLPKNLEVGFKLQALDLGTTRQIAFPFDAIANRYSNTTLTPWIENAYVKAHDFLDRPIELTIGRQPLVVGDGFLISDDNLGLLAIRAQAKLFWNFGLDLFTAKPSDGQTGENDFDLHGAALSHPWKGQWELFYFVERDRTGTAFNAVSTSMIDKRYYDIRYEQKKENFFATAEVALGKGKIKPLAGTGNITIDSMAYLVRLGASTEAKKLGKTELTFTYGAGSGDKAASADKAEGFFPHFGRRFDGMERTGFGEFFAATVYDALPSTTTANGLPSGVSGIGIIGFGGSVTPWYRFKIGFDYYIFKAQESPREKALGSEVDLSCGYRYSDYLSFRLSYAMFNPGDAANVISKSRTTRLLLETQARF